MWENIRVMKQLFIVKTGSTFASTAKQYGDFEDWTRAALGPVEIAVAVVDPRQGVPLPRPSECAGVVITGSHAMVTDAHPWSLQLERWIADLIDAETPLFGICFGHQLLARATGGTVGFHPHGIEIGTTQIDLLAESAQDSIFQDLPDTFAAHVAHSQTVLELPPNAVRLAANSHEVNHAMRIGPRAWGIQFHPEFDPAIMRAYIHEQADQLRPQGINPQIVAEHVTDTPTASMVLRRFAQLAISTAHS